MAEFCEECFKKTFGHHPKGAVDLAWLTCTGLCEGCGYEYLKKRYNILEPTESDKAVAYIQGKYGGSNE